MSKQSKELIREYEMKKNYKERLRDERVRKIYKKFPELEEIEREKKEIWINHFLKIPDTIGENISKEEKAKKRKKEKEKNAKKFKELEKRKKAIMDKNNISKSDFDVSYDCDICKDTGYVIEDGKRKRCKCFTQKLIEKSYEESNLKRVVKNTFDNFSLDYYSDVKKDGVSPREKVKKLYNDLKYYTENFGRIKDSEYNSIFLTGKTGVGKTHLSEAVGNELIKKGYTVLYQSANMLFSKLVEYKFNDIKRYNEYLDNLINIDMLIIDDLGIESGNAPTKEEVFTVINERIIRNNPIVISTNLSLQDIIDTYGSYGDRILSRIAGNSRMYKIEGEDIRAKNAGKTSKN